MTKLVLCKLKVVITIWDAHRMMTIKTYAYLVKRDKISFQASF